MIAQLLVIAAGSLAVHELGHLTVGAVLGYRCALRWRLLGPCAVIGTDLQPGDIRGTEAILIALAGPIFSAQLLVLGLVIHQWMIVVMQLNMLLVASILDYWHAIKAWRR